MMNDWDANAYSQFLDLRTRPARDLLAAIPNSFQPKIVYDLGCGPGNSTILLNERWPDANLIGLDSSPAMLKEAKVRYPYLHFIQENIADFIPLEKMDCLFANASLQWLNNHQILIPHLLKFINLNGMFAIQMPNNFHAPSHQIAFKVLQDNKAWQPHLEKLQYGILTKPLYNLTWYYDLLSKAGGKFLQLWETEYFQEMSNYQEIFNWIRGTEIRTILSAMDKNEQAKFISDYIEGLSREYPIQTNNKVLLPFRRIFMLGCKGE